MNLYLTNGFHGNKSKILSTNVQSTEQIFEAIENWKKLEETRKQYKVEPYSTFTMHDGCIIVDFGDYGTFLEIGNMTDKDISAFKNMFKTYE